MNRSTSDSIGTPLYTQPVLSANFVKWVLCTVPFHEVHTTNARVLWLSRVGSRFALGCVKAEAFVFEGCVAARDAVRWFSSPTLFIHPAEENPLLFPEHQTTKQTNKKHQ